MMMRGGFLTLVGVVIGTMSALPAWAQTDQVTYYHSDAVGSVRVITNASGQVVMRHDYLPFGEEWQPPTPNPERRLFAGKEQDQESGLNYFGARYNASGQGRFMTVDPFFNHDEALVDPQRWNRYAYVGNNPLRYVDPYGLYQFDTSCGEGDSECLENQQRFRDALAAVRAAANQLDAGSKERKELERILKGIGESEGRGAVIAFRHFEDKLAFTNPVTGRMQFDLSAIDAFASRVTDVREAFFPAIVAHEGRHLVGGGFLGLNRTDTASFFAESYVFQGLRANERIGPLWDNSWLSLSPQAREANRTEGVRRYPR
jgi:RHS repeat-associated protein